jgi:hypothetical protein
MAFRIPFLPDIVAAGRGRTGEDDIQFCRSPAVERGLLLCKSFVNVRYRTEPFTGRVMIPTVALDRMEIPVFAV